MKQKRINDKDQERILEILNRCEIGVFTSADDTADRKTTAKRNKGTA